MIVRSIFILFLYLQQSYYCQERIQHGTRAVLGMFKFVGVVLRYNQVVCTASLLDEKTVLTAAHCCLPDTCLYDTVKFGAIHALNDNRYSQTASIATVHIHPAYTWESTRSRYYDYAILKLVSPIHFTRFIQPIRITWLAPNKGDQVVFVGYGLEEHNRKTNYLNYITKKLHAVDKDVLVTLRRHGGSNKGDSGGPVVMRNDENKWVQVGVMILIWGGFNVHSKISCAYDWIINLLEDCT